VHKDVALGNLKAFNIYKNILQGKDVGQLQPVAIENERDQVQKVEPVAVNPKKEVSQVKPTERASSLVQSDGLEYMIQLAAAHTKIDLTRAKYVDIADRSTVKKSDGYYRYLLPAGNSADAASKVLAEIKKNGFPKVFISVYKGDERVKILYK